MIKFKNMSNSVLDSFSGICDFASHFQFNDFAGVTDG